MFKRKQISTAVKIAAGLAVVAVPVQGAFAADDVLEEIVVTGSRIARTNFDTAAQLVSMDRMSIDAQGTLGVADVLRQSPVNTFGSFSETSGSSWQSQATMDLRGLGPSRTLVMLNGRRVVGSPNMGASNINLNMIPMASVDRIDILADGGSAVYGSDAVAGVVNLVMRKDFEGLEFTVRSGDRSEDNGSEEGLAMLLGITSDRGSITVAAEYNKRDAIFDKDREGRPLQKAFRI
jgi:iron complex outermembrane receptor protein